MDTAGRLEGKTLYSFGDSLIAGHYNGTGMLDHVTLKHHITYHKYAINGASVIPCEPKKLDNVNGLVYDIGTQIQMAPDEPPDFICFDGLTNDAYDKIIRKHLGTISSDYCGSYDTTSFAGAFEAICWRLREKYQNSKIIYITPHKMPSRTAYAQETLVNCALTICRKWSVPYVDMYHRGGINTCIPGMCAEFSYNGKGETSHGNGTHLNEAGYHLWYAPAIEAELLKNLSD